MAKPWVSGFRPVSSARTLRSRRGRCTPSSLRQADSPASSVVGKKKSPWKRTPAWVVGHDCGPAFKGQYWRFNYYESGTRAVRHGDRVAGSSTPRSALELSKTPTEAVTNQRVTLTATVQTSSESPLGGTVEFTEDGERSQDANTAGTSDWLILCRDMRASFASSGDSIAAPSLRHDPARTTGEPRDGKARGFSRLDHNRLEDLERHASVNTSVTYTATVTRSISGHHGPLGQSSFSTRGSR